MTVYDSSVQFIVKSAGEVIGTARVRFVKIDCAKIERMAVLKTYRKQGAGTTLLSFILSHIETSQVIPHAQWAAIPFYKAAASERPMDRSLKLASSILKW
jgi:GNAT superfamily N-acetyltransferase